MSSSFAEAFNGVQKHLDDVFGVPVVYNGSDITIRLESFDRAVERYPEVYTASAVIGVKTSDVKRPEKGDTVVYDGNTYQVSDILRRDGLSSVVALTNQMTRVDVI